MMTRIRGALSHMRGKEDGSIALSLILLMPVMLIAVGIVVDTATKYQGNERASQVAQSAASAAANAVGGSVQDSGSPSISAGAAAAVARSYIIAAGLTPTSAVVSGSDITVSVSGTVPTKFLSLIGIHNLPIKASAHARLITN
jgi:Flp pilus assembly protein TadG